MVALQSIAVVVRSRGGRNIILQTRGLDVKVVLGAVQEVANTVEVVSPSQRLAVTGLMAFYRLINQTVAIVLSPEGSNVFTGIDLLSAVSKLLMVECKAVELPPERALSLDKKYAQVYLAIDALLGRGHGNALRALQEGISTLGELAPGAAAAKKSQLKDEPSADGTTRMAPKRKLAMQAELLSQFNFSTASAINMTPTVTDDNDPFALLPDATVQPGTSANQLSSLEELLGAPQAAAPAEDPFAFANDAVLTLPQAAEATAVGQAEAMFTGGAAEANRGTPQRGIAQPPQGPALKLMEVWRSEVLGSHVTRAGMHGQVLWASGDVRTLSPAVPFRLVAPPFPDAQLRAALQTAQRHERASELSSEPGTFIATSISPVPVSTPVLQYWLPASFCKPPLVGQLGAACGDLPDGTFSLQLGVQFAVSPDPSLHIDELSIDVHVPPTMGNPVRVMPKGEWSSSQRCLRWQVNSVHPGMAGTANAMFIVAAGREAAAAAMPNMSAVIRLRGTAGDTLSGTTLQQASNTMSPLQPSSTECCWVAEVVAWSRPPVPLEL